jgi:radical SAM protein with 4Fe4S-binding SPASM domain
MKDPFHIQWHITDLCNLRCQHCYQDDFSREKDLDWPELKRIADHLTATIKNWARTACIHLTGGEPFLKPELFALLNCLDQNPAVEELGIITNGLLLDEEIVKRLSAFSKLKKIKISLDGADQETNDSIRGKGTFEKVIRNVPLMKAGKAFDIVFMFTLMKRNFRELPSYVRLCQEIGADGLIIERFIPWGRGGDRKDEVLGKRDWEEFTEILLNLFSIEEKISLLPYQAFQVRFNHDGPELLGAPCVIGVDGLCIMPNGDLFPCRRFPIPIGNLLNNSMSQIWNVSEILEKLRRKENLKGKCGRCEIKNCRGCRSLALSLTGDSLGEDPHCWYVDA